MKTALIGAAAFAAALSFALPAAAQSQTLQVQSGTVSPRALSIDGYDPLGQSFTAFTDTITSVGFEFTTLNPQAALETLTFDIYAGETLSGVSLFNTSFQFPASIDVRDERAWYDIAVPNLAVVRGGTYSLILRGQSSFRAALLTGPGYNSTTAQFFGGDAYTGGRLLSAVSTYPNCAGPTSNCDANFRVTGNIVTAAVPEPATWAMFILGFGLCGGNLRRRAARRPHLVFS